MNVNIECPRHTSIGMKNPLLGLQAYAILDDTSGMIIAGREYIHCNTENSIEVIDELVREYWDICPLR